MNEKFIDDKTEVLSKIDGALIKAQSRDINGDIHVIVNIFNGGIGRARIETLETEVIKK